MAQSAPQIVIIAAPACQKKMSALHQQTKIKGYVKSIYLFELPGQHGRGF